MILLDSQKDNDTYDEKSWMSKYLDNIMQNQDEYIFILYNLTF